MVVIEVAARGTLNIVVCPQNIPKNVLWVFKLRISKRQNKEFEYCRRLRSDKSGH
jgi:hypothetical protein